MAPEVLSNNKYSEKADIYSFGIVLYEIISGKYPYEEKEFADLNNAQLIYQITEKNAHPTLEDEFFEPAMKQLILDCWKRDPEVRPAFSEIITRLKRMKSDIPDAQHDYDSGSAFASPDFHSRMESSSSNTYESVGVHDL